ncbi:type II CAAX endopeptidase family protein [Halostagnicola sp. A-GB9-2]|uniref:CPBP family intramembrane glutamic endopeptidase n=1 Tax=Halostagnicola sp. A-GB9-2 TaxID=3048066 RepID=UPI0024C0747B|nr:type II CAAX endopeptidase family protein [Halostagnicola sp. A-GB9-2]MDJ1431454.1 type II CAAX endopeptidase family protein [Halostagnicola sp. A-GB9-2]
MSRNEYRGTAGRVAILARAGTPWGFPVIYLGWAYLFWVPIIVSDASVWSFPNVGFFIVGGTSPLLAAVLLSWFLYGRAGVRDLGHRLIDVGRISLRWWLILVLFWPVFNLVMAGIALVFGIMPAPLEFISTDRLFDPVVVISILVFAFVLPLPEEIGLRGYWLDRLQERFSALTAGLTNGITWTIWHAPFVLLPGYYAHTTFQPELSWWMPMLVLITLFHVWMYNNTNRSILAVLVFHAFVNLTGEVMGFAPQMYPFVLTGYVLVAVLLIAGWSPKSLRGWKRARPPVTDLTGKSF